MSVPDNVKHIVPLVRLGRCISMYQFAVEPDPFDSKGGKEDPVKLRSRVDQETLKVRGIIGVDPAMATLRKILGLADGQFPDAQMIQVLSYILYWDACTVRGDQTIDAISCRLGALFGGPGEGLIEGRLIARSCLAAMLEQGVIAVYDHAIHPSGPIMEWLTGGNLLMSYGLNEQMVQRHLANRERKVAQNVQKAPQQPNKGANAVSQFVGKLPILTPAEMDAMVAKTGYVGQENARLIICLSAYRHVQRLRRVYLEGIDPASLPPRENILCIGPTGCGKTYLMKTLFDRVLRIPSVVCDITKFTEQGYVGEDVENILTRLLISADGDAAVAQCGMVCIDEIDKLAGSARSRNRYGGEGMTKDVSGLGVQKGLLKLLEGSVVETPVEIGGYRSRTVPFDTSNVLFVGAGAFSGLELIEGEKRRIGFEGLQGTGEAKTGDFQALNRSSDAGLADAIFSYGLMMEFLGRFHQFVRFNDLSREQLRQIIKETTVQEYRRELSLEGIGLDIAPSVFDVLVDRARERKTGARGLASGLIGVLSHAMFQAYSSKGSNRRIRIFDEDGDIRWDIQTKPSVRSKATIQRVSPVASVGGSA